MYKKELVNKHYFVNACAQYNTAVACMQKLFHTNTYLI